MFQHAQSSGTSDGAQGVADEEDEGEDGLPSRPRTRGDCVDGPRPCPWVACRHHLYLDVRPETGSIKFNFPNLAPEDMGDRPTCSLDVADQGGTTLEVVGETMNLTRERVRQIEVRTLVRLRVLTDHR